MAMTMTITVHDNGQLEVSGPLENKIVCYGLLEAARDAVQQHHDQAKRLVQPVSLVPHEFGKVNGG
jgi:hypothetical protein